MGYPEKTYELYLTPDCKQAKERLMAWLVGHGVDNFVEGALDNLDIDHEYTFGEQEQHFLTHGGTLAPISIYKFDLQYLQELAAKIGSQFEDHVKIEIREMQTTTWTEGWKESFRPIETKRFVILPPWEKQSIPSDDRIKLFVEPGMAFGTGQHATTKLCLTILERFVSRHSPQTHSFADIGTGTGILALAAKKLNFQSVVATDIDPDAILAARYNMELNETPFQCIETDIPEGMFDMIVANILYHVLVKLLSKFANATRSDGHVIFSGILSEQRLAFIHAARPFGFAEQEYHELEGWVGILMKRV